jgi:hypothetical protein
MGQYHHLVNVDKKEVVYPYRLGMGAKQREQLGMPGSMADALYLLVMTSPARGGGDLPQTAVSGRWAGDRVLVYGDYTKDSDVPSIPNLTRIWVDEFKDITDLVAFAIKTAFGRDVRDSFWHPENEERKEAYNNA